MKKLLMINNKKIKEIWKLNNNNNKKKQKIFLWLII